MRLPQSTGTTIRNTPTIPIPAVPPGPVPRQIARQHPADAQRRHPVLALGALAAAAAASYVPPIAATLIVAALITLLRAGDKARSGLAVRHETRGRRAWDPAHVLTSMPWVLARSVIETMTMRAAGVVAMTIADLILIQTPPTWPLPSPPAMNVHVSGFGLDRFHI